MSDKHYEGYYDLVELRRRLINIIIVLVLTILISFFYADTVIHFLKEDAKQSFVEWNVFSISESFSIYIKICIILALIVTLPFSMYQLWKFVAPGLNINERKSALKYIPVIFILFITGITFSYYVVFPFTLRFMTSFSNKIGVVEVYGVAEYFSFLFSIVIPISFIFELPIIIMFLTKLNIVNPKLLRKYRKYLYLILFILSALITPPDIVSHLFVTLPLFLAYEISILLSNRIYKK